MENVPLSVSSSLCISAFQVKILKINLFFFRKANIYVILFHHSYSERSQSRSSYYFSCFVLAYLFALLIFKGKESWPTAQMTTKDKIWPGQSQELKTQPRSLTEVTGTQYLNHQLPFSMVSISRILELGVELGLQSRPCDMSCWQPKQQQMPKPHPCLTLEAQKLCSLPINSLLTLVNGKPLGPSCIASIISQKTGPKQTEVLRRWHPRKQSGSTFKVVRVQSILVCV